MCARAPLVYGLGCWNGVGCTSLVDSTGTDEVNAHQAFPVKSHVNKTKASRSVATPREIEQGNRMCFVQIDSLLVHLSSLRSSCSTSAFRL